MAVYTYSRVPAFNPNTSPVSVAKSATGSVYDVGDTGFVTALTLTLVASNTAATTLVSDANGMFPDFTLVDRTQCVFKSGTQVFVLTTTTPIPGPVGPASTVAGPAGPATTDASLLAAGTVADARLPVRLGDPALIATYASRSTGRISSLLNRFAPADTQLLPALSTDAPTVTLATASAVTGSTVSVMSTTELNLLGTRGTWETNYGRMRVGDTVTPGIETMLYGDTLELCFDTNVGTGGAQPFWIFVDGKPCTAATFNAGNSAGQGSRSYLKLAFTSVATRRVEIFGESILAFVQIGVPFTGTLTAPPRKPVVGFVFDSFGAGAVTDTYLSAPFLIARQLGVECVNASLGGTGYVNPGSFYTFGNAARVSNVSVAVPELIIMSGSVNDDAQTGIQAAAASAYAAYQTACPNAKIIVFGAQPNNSVSTLSTNRNTNNAALKAAALAAPNVLAFHDMIGTAGGLPPAWTAGGTHTDGDVVTYNGSVWRWRGPTDGNSVPGSSSRWERQTYVYTGTGKAGSNRSVTDGATTSASTTITSATAAFTSADVGFVITGAGIPTGTKIASVTNGTTAVLSVAATATATAVSLTITNQTGDGNRDYLLGSDGTHPTTGASAAFAIAQAATIRADIRAIATA